jgi:eukaryotic-like serine/threonine-protein kinase
VLESMSSSGELFVTQEDRVVAGRYRLGARLGSGAMGIVWQAHDDRLHRTVAVKQLLLDPGLTAAQADEARRRSMREGRIAARLSHPNAVTVYDVAEYEGQPWLIMEYLPSRSLATVIAEQGPLPPEEVARIGAHVAAALDAAHAAGIVHRDVKPANVLLGDDGTVKITDFGISRAVGDVTVTATGMLAGTPAYLAPEVAKGQEPTAASDVFSLGSTLYTAVEGHSPFGLGENTLALLYAVAAGKVDPPRQAGPLTALLMRLLRADPVERPTMVEARDALAAVAAGRTAQVAANTEIMSPIPLVPTPPPGVERTRLDARPFAEPMPSGPVRHQPPPPPMPPRPPRPRAEQSQGSKVRSVVLTVLAVVAAALVGILVASLLSSTRHNSQAAPAPTTSAAGTTSASPKPTTSSSNSPPTSVTAPAGRSAADYENAIRQYYGLLPANPGAAWAMLTERAQRRSGNQDGYNKFWARIKSVEVLSAKAEGARVAAALRFTTLEGKDSTEAYVFALVDQGGQLMIDNFAQGGRPPEENTPPSG